MEISIYDLIELSTLLQIDCLCKSNPSLAFKLQKMYDANKMTNRYEELLDKFLNNYALNKSEKSE